MGRESKKKQKEYSVSILQHFEGSTSEKATSKLIFLKGE